MSDKKTSKPHSSSLWSIKDQREYRCIGHRNMSGYVVAVMESVESKNIIKFATLPVLVRGKQSEWALSKSSCIDRAIDKLMDNIVSLNNKRDTGSSLSKQYDLNLKVRCIHSMFLHNSPIEKDSVWNDFKYENDEYSANLFTNNKNKTVIYLYRKVKEDNTMEEVAIWKLPKL